MLKKVSFALLPTLLILLSPSIVNAGPTDSIYNPINNFGSLGDIITAALPIVFGLVVLLAVIVFTIGALRYLTSQGDPKAAESARATMTGSVIGMVIVLGTASVSGVFQRIFGLSFFGSPASGNVPSSSNVLNLACAFKLSTGKCIGESFSSFGDLITYILLLLLSVGALVFFFMLIWGGIRYMLARGDEKAVASARGTLTNAFVGLLLMISALVIIRLIVALLFNAGNLVF